jgi:hypothetical protein
LSCGEILIPACESSMNDLKRERTPTFNIQRGRNKNTINTRTTTKHGIKLKSDQADEY